MTQAVTMRKQKRKTLALKVTPAGFEALIPAHLDPDSAAVRDLIGRAPATASPPAPAPEGDRVDRAGVSALVQEWAERLGVTVDRMRIQPMRNKGGSISTAGNLTPAADLLDLPRTLVDYVVCHERDRALVSWAVYDRGGADD